MKYAQEDLTMISRSDLKLLDYAAMLAMQAMIARGSLTAAPHATVADDAYRMAEAMIKSTRRRSLQIQNESD